MRVKSLKCFNCAQPITRGLEHIQDMPGGRYSVPVCNAECGAIYRGRAEAEDMRGDPFPARATLSKAQPNSNTSPTSPARPAQDGAR